MKDIAHLFGEDPQFDGPPLDAQVEKLVNDWKTEDDPYWFTR